MPAVSDIEREAAEIGRRRRDGLDALTDLTDLVPRARAAGLSMKRIAELVGVTPQALANLTRRRASRHGR